MRSPRPTTPTRRAGPLRCGRPSSAPPSPPRPMSATTTKTATFNRSHAHYVATKVAADLRRMQHLYDWPTDKVIDDLIEEITEMLALDYLKTVEIGFER